MSHPDHPESTPTSTGHRRFGLIGHPVGHSFSARYFEGKWAREGIQDCTYGLHDLAEVGEVLSLWRDPDWVGMNVTVPYKRDIIPLLDDLSDEARIIGAVNVVAFTPSGRVGHNTDAPGFRRSIAPFLEAHHHRALVLGTGGSAAAVCHALGDIGLDVTCVSRRPNRPGDIGYGDLSAEGIRHVPLIVNCTPVGMHPDSSAMPPLPLEALSGIGPDHLVVDLIYTPARTRLLEAASALGARTLGGSSMLQHQADAAWEIWVGDRDAH